MFVNRLWFRGTLGNLNGRRVNSPCQQGKLLPSRPPRARPGPDGTHRPSGGPGDLAGSAA